MEAVGCMGSAHDTNAMETTARAVIPDLGTTGDHSQRAEKRPLMKPEGKRLGRERAEGKV